MLNASPKRSELATTLDQRRLPRAAAHSWAQMQPPVRRTRGHRLHDQPAFDCNCGFSGTDGNGTRSGSTKAPYAYSHRVDGRCEERRERRLPRGQRHSYLIDFGHTHRQLLGRQHRDRAQSVRRYHARVRHFAENLDPHQCCRCDQHWPSRRIARPLRDLRWSHRADAERHAHNQRGSGASSFHRFTERAERCSSSGPGTVADSSSRRASE